MELRDRKRINNIPRFNIGADSNVLLSLFLGAQNQSLFGFSSNPIVNSYFNNNGTNNILNMDYVRGAASNMGKVKVGNDGFNISAGEWQSMAGNAASSIGDAFSQSNKFTDSASNNVRNYGGVIAKLIPGKYGLAASEAVDLSANTIGMINYKHTNDEMWNNAGVSDRNINGINYKTQNIADTAGTYRDVKSTGVKNAISMGLKGSAAGLAVGGPVGAIVGGVLGNVLGIFGGRKAAIRLGRINRNAIKQTSMINAQQLAYANSEALQTKYYQNNQDTSDDILYANRGKDLRLRKRINNNKYE